MKVAAYTTGALTAYSRVRLGKHFTSDVIVGAALGTAVGHSVTKFNRRLRYGPDRTDPDTGARFTLMPVVNAGVYGLFAAVSF